MWILAALVLPGLAAAADAGSAGSAAAAPGRARANSAYRSTARRVR